MGDTEIVKWVLGLFTSLLSFFLYTTRDKLKEYRQEQTEQNKEINDLKSELHLMKNTTVTDKELTGYLNDLKRELNAELSSLAKSMNDHREESSTRMMEMRDTVNRLAVLLEQENKNGN